MSGTEINKRKYIYPYRIDELDITQYNDMLLYDFHCEGITLDGEMIYTKWMKPREDPSRGLVKSQKCRQLESLIMQCPDIRFSLMR